MYEAKNSKICNFWTFWPVIQLVNHLFPRHITYGLVNMMEGRQCIIPDLHKED